MSIQDQILSKEIYDQTDNGKTTPLKRVERNTTYQKVCKELKRHTHNIKAKFTGGNKRYATFAKYLDAEHEGPYSATDAIIRMKNDAGVEGIVLINRKDNHKIAYAGGMAEAISFEENTIKEAKEETGLDFIIDAPEQPYRVTSKLGNDARAHIASHYYTGVGRGVICPDPEEDAESARLVTLNELEELVKDEKEWSSKSHLRVMKAYLQDHDAIVANFGWYDELKRT